MAEQLCFTWNNSVSDMMRGFNRLLANQSLVDVTLACDGVSLKAHKVVLSAWSPFFLTMFVENPCTHPIVILKDVKYTDMKVLLDFIYFGRINISRDQLKTLKQTADILRMSSVSEIVTEKIQELSQPSVSRPDEPSSKRRLQKSSSNDRSDGRASESGSSDSDIEEVYSSKLPLEACGNETVVPTIPEETLQNKISLQEDNSSVQTSNNNPTTRSISVANNSSEITNQQPEYSAGNVPVQDLMSNLKKAVETLQEKGMLTTDKKGQSADENSADRESSTSIPDIEIIINGDSDIEEIDQDKVARQEMMDLDDDELILTDVIPGSKDSSQQMKSVALNQQTERPSEISKGKRFTENENNRSVAKLSSRSISQDEPPSKRRKRRRQRASKRSASLVLQLDSDGEVVSNEASSSFSTASTVDLNMKRHQSQQQCPDKQIVDKANAPNGNASLEPNKLSEKTLTTDDLSITSAATLNVKSSCQTQQQHPDAQVDDKVYVQSENSDFQSDKLLETNITTDVPSNYIINPNFPQVPLSLESPSGELVRDLLQELVAQASGNNDGVFYSN